MLTLLKKLLDWLRYNFLDLALISIILGTSIFVAFRNYVPGTWLLGWDNLVPELDFKLNIARNLSVAWQEYQGLGLLGGMAHAADLPRQIILWIMSLVIPTSGLRYFWTFLMLAIGPLGVYWLTSRVFITKKVGFLSKISGLAASFFYLFNLATLQTFYTPFETFVSFYGFFPWLLYFGTCYLSRERRSDLVKYAIVSILATCAFYVQTLFIVYAVFLLVFALETVVKLGKSGLLRCGKLGIVTLFANAFWLLPVIYFGLTSAAVPANSHINSIATSETQFMNQARASFTDIATLKGYWFDYYDWGKNGTYDYLYKTWIDYRGQPAVEKVSIALFVVSALGLALSLLKKKTSYGLSLLALFVISYFMLDGGTISFIPFFSDIFRNAFTKWANVLAFVLAVGSGYFIYVVTDIFQSKIFKFGFATTLTAVMMFFSVYTVWPVFEGNLISGSMIVQLPSYYLDTINYFKSQDPTKRIANLPLTDFWGWKFNDWGYRGSGFLWYGIPQPMLDRAFDVWSPYNQEFYKDINYSVLYGGEVNFEQVLTKYQVSFILFDESIFETGNPNSDSNIQKEKIFLGSSPIIQKVKEFGKITIYKVNLPVVNSFVSAPQVDYGQPFIKTSQIGDLKIIEAFSVSQNYQTAKNCDLKGQGSVVGKGIFGGNYYSAAGGGVSCGYFYYPFLDYSKAYLIRIKGENVSGRSLKFYLYNNKSKNVDLEELLPAGRFDKSFLILPTTKEGSVGEGYTLNLETRSFGESKSVNIVSAIEFYNVGYQNLSGLDLQNNDLKISNVQKYGTWLYQVDVQGSGLIQLGQGYDSGWLAFSARDFPFAIFHLSFLEHVKVNSWANGWLVPSNQPINQSTIYLIYWPQLLEWLGMGLGCTAFLVLTLL
jgi:hypothetical protein